MDMITKFNGGVIMDVTNVEQAKIAEEAGAVAVMALERVPADIRAAGGVSRMRTLNDSRNYGSSQNSCYGKSKNWAFRRS